MKYFQLITFSEKLCSFDFLLKTPIAFSRVVEVCERLIESDDMHGESKDEYRQHSQETRQVFEQVTDDDRPRTEEMMERKKVQNLNAREKKRERKKLIPYVHESRPVGPSNEIR